MNVKEAVEMLAIVVLFVGLPLAGAAVLSHESRPTRIVQGIAASGPVCMQARARDVVEADGLCIVGTGDTSVIVHYCRVSP